MENLFVYGTLKQPEVQMKVIGREVQSVEDTLLGYTKENISINGNTYFILVKGDGEVEGLILTVTEKELIQMDEYETSAYRRIREKLKSGRETWVYVK